jgi:hypothetical protein
LNRTLFWTERSAASWHAPRIFVLYVYLAVFYRAPRDRDLNSIPKWCGTPMARGLRLQRGTIGNRSEASQWNFVETSWQLRSEWSRMWKPLKFWTLEVCFLCSTRVLRVTRLSRRARHTIFCGCFLPDQSKLSGSRQKMTGHHQISWWQRNFAHHQKYRPASSICNLCICFLDQERVSYTMRYLLHFTKVYFSQ